MFIIWRGSGILTAICLLIGVAISWLFLKPGTPVYRGTAFIVATVLNLLFVARIPGSLFFIPVKIWTFIFLGAFFYFSFFYS